MPPMAFAKPASDIAVTSLLSDYDANLSPYLVQSDGGGAYTNGANGATSILVANGYNGIVWGDWRLDLSASTLRTIRVTFAQANAVQPGDPGYTAPANPPYWGTQFEAVRMENKCSLDHHDMLTMKAGDKFTCDFSIRFPPSTRSTFYRLEMDPTLLNEPETKQVQVACNAANSGGCSDWFLDPIPVVNGAKRGDFSPVFLLYCRNVGSRVTRNENPLREVLLDSTSDVSSLRSPYSCFNCRRPIGAPTDEINGHRSYQFLVAHLVARKGRMVQGETQRRAPIRRRRFDPHFRGDDCPRR